MMNDDMVLVREYAASRSEHAFETLVSRHVNLVYTWLPCLSFVRTFRSLTRQD